MLGGELAQSADNAFVLASELGFGLPSHGLRK